MIVRASSIGGDVLADHALDERELEWDRRGRGQVEAVGQLRDGLSEREDPVEAGPALAAGWGDDVAGADQCGDGQRAEVRRCVDDDALVVIQDGGEGIAEEQLSADFADEAQFDAGQLAGGGDRVEPVDARDDRIGRGCPADEDVHKVDAERVGLEAELAGERELWVGVDDRYSHVGPCEHGGDVRGGGRPRPLVSLMGGNPCSRAADGLTLDQAVELIGSGTASTLEAVHDGKVVGSRDGLRPSRCGTRCHPAVNGCSRSFSMMLDASRGRGDTRRLAARSASDQSAAAAASLRRR